MNVRTFVLCAVWVVLGGVAFTPAAESGKKLNVLWIMADDLREHGGAYTKGAVKTPNLDRLRERGVSFTRAYAQYPVCNPSRVSMLTGLRPEQTHIFGNHAFFREQFPDIVTFPQLLRQNGWTTHSYGKILHTANTGESHREDWLDVGKSWDHAESKPAASPHRRGEFRNLTGGKLAWCEVGILGGEDDEQPDGQTAVRAIQAIEELNASGKPWMVAAGFHRPHDPFHAPRKYFDLYPEESVKVYEDPPDMTPGEPMTIPGGWGPIFAQFSEEEQRAYMRSYLAGVSFMDAQVGRLLETLDRLKLWDSTVVVFLGDHGFHLGERKWWNKTTLFERSCRAPLIMAAPGVKGGQECGRPVEFVDLYPTITELCGLAPRHELAGKSLGPLLKNTEREHKGPAMTMVMRGQLFGQSARTERWRLTRWSDGTMELYDHEKDPEETRNVAKDPKNQGVITELQAKMQNL